MPIYEVVSEARTYRRAAHILEASIGIGDAEMAAPASMLAAYAIEIYLKSFLLEDDRRPIMKVGDYIIEQGALKTPKHLMKHDLVFLFEQIDVEWQKKIEYVSSSINPNLNLKEQLQRYRLLFPRVRYPYGADSQGVLHGSVFGFLDHMDEVCERLLPRVCQPGEV